MSQDNEETEKKSEMTPAERAAQRLMVARLQQQFRDETLKIADPVGEAPANFWEGLAKTLSRLVKLYRGVVTGPRYGFKVGDVVFVQTVTNYYTGVVKENFYHAGAGMLVLALPTWIASTGRFHAAMTTGKFSETEPFAPEQVIQVNWGSVVSAVNWPHDLPLKTQ